MKKHDQLIKRLCEEKSALTHRWLHHTAEAIFHLGDDMPEWQENFPLKEIKDEIREEAGNISPDAFLVIPHEKRLIWWEVEVTNPMPSWKARRLMEVEFELSEWDFHLEIRVVDRYGNDCRVYTAKTENGYDLLSEKLYQEHLQKIKAKFDRERKEQAEQAG